MAPSPIYLRTFMQGVDGAIFGKGELARRVTNLVRTTRSTMRTLRGPCLYEVRDTETITSPVGVFHAQFLRGTTPLLLVRSGTSMYKHVHSGWEQIETGLSWERRPLYPDMWAVINDRVIWSNGIDRARQIDAYGRVFTLGFDKPPSAPQAMGPQANNAALSSKYPNYASSWPGEIGTVMDVLYGEAGTLASSEHLLVDQFIHHNGDMSPLSPTSNPARIAEIHANPYFSGAAADQASFAELSALRRQFWYSAGSPKENGDVKATRLGRTRDVKRYGPATFLLSEVPGVGELAYPDRLSDSYLTLPMQDMFPVPIIQAMCSHAGSLVISNGPRVLTSLPGLAGSFPVGSDQYPSSHGADVTALASYRGRKLAYTLDSIVDITEGREVILEGGGAAGPRCVCPIPGVGLLSLGPNGAYLIKQDGTVDAEVGLPILDLLRYEISHVALRRATSTYVPETREAIFWVPRAGSGQVYDLALSFDGVYWRYYDIGTNVRDCCVTDDPRKLVLLAGADVPGGGTTHSLFVWDRENRAYDPPARTAVFESGWMQWSEEATAFTVRDLLIEVIDASMQSAQVELFVNGSWDTPMTTAFTVKTINADIGSGIFDDRLEATTSLNGTAKMREPRAMWRQVNCANYLDGVHSFAFRVTFTYPNAAEVGRFIVSAAPVPVPKGGDEMAMRLARLYPDPVVE